MQTIGSKIVAEMLGKRHDNFLRDIRKYIANLEDKAPKYFVDGTYTDGMGKVRSCYEVTLAGCELIAGRMIGDKGTEFREKYLQILQPAEETKEELVTEDLTVEEVAKRLGCSERNVYRIIKNGVLKGIQKEILIPTTKTFVTKEALEEYLREKGERIA